MKFTKDTIEIIKNFNQITESGMRFPKGNVLSVRDGMGQGENSFNNITTVGIALLVQDLDEEFLVYDPIQFFSALNSFEEANVELEDQTILVADSKNKKLGSFKFAMASPEVVGKTVSAQNFPEDDGSHIHLTLEAASINQLFKAVGIVISPYIMFRGEGGDLLCRGFDKENPTADQYNMPIGVTDQEFEIPVRVDSINKLMKGIDYDVTLTQRGIVRFCGDFNGNILTYYFTASV